VVVALAVGGQKQALLPLAAVAVVVVPA